MQPSILGKRYSQKSFTVSILLLLFVTNQLLSFNFNHASSNLTQKMVACDDVSTHLSGVFEPPISRASEAYQQQAYGYLLTIATYPASSISFTMTRKERQLQQCFFRFSEFPFSEKFRTRQKKSYFPGIFEPQVSKNSIFAENSNFPEFSKLGIPVLLGKFP